MALGGAPRHSHDRFGGGIFSTDQAAGVSGIFCEEARKNAGSTAKHWFQERVDLANDSFGNQIHPEV